MQSCYETGAGMVLVNLEVKRKMGRYSISLPLPWLEWPVNFQGMPVGVGGETMKRMRARSLGREYLYDLLEMRWPEAVAGAAELEVRIDD